MTEKHPNLAAALAAFQGEMPTVAKTKRANVGQYAYTYADLADVTETASPVLSRHGLAYAGSARHVEGGRYEVVGILSHESGEQRDGALPIVGGNAQQIGSSITYMRRYLFGLMTGVVTDNDDDGHLASAAPKRKPKAAAPPDDPQRYEPAQPGAAGAPVSEKQVKLIGVLMGKLHLKDRDLALQYVADVTGRTVTTRNELSAREASKVIDALQADLGETPPEDAA